MKRFAEENLARWLKTPHRKPLVIRGARQVGKSTLVRQFAENNGLRLFEVNLERYPTLLSVFKTNDPGRIMRELEYLCGKGSIRTEKDLIFLDEIQAIPEAIQSLRYFFEEYPHIPLIAAGSLLEFALAKHSFSMPVGRIQYLFLYPMSFEEVLEAMSQGDLLSLLRTYKLDDTFPGTAHARLLELQRKYFLTGGMPEAVQRFIESDGDFSCVADVHSSITETYKDDFARYSSRSALQMIHRVFEYVPLGIGEKFKYSSVSPDSPARDVRAALELLVKAQLIVRAYHTDGSGLPLGATINKRVFKTYFLDCGLVNHMCGVTRISLEDLQTFINKGKIAEQFIAQHLCIMSRATGFKSLTYWLREGRTANAEVDFLVQLDQSIVPVEVKAGKSGSLKSLLQFVSQKNCTRAVRFDLNPPSLQHISHRLAQAGATVQVEYDLLSLPLYLIEQLPRLF
ncbi:AAA+ family ATPase [Candidatus Fermentibacteria bacterium]|nr:MAG: AAA+ family ATPase [Candidatus Fermentibacteria bacterium]